MFYEIGIATSKREEMIDITGKVADVVRNSGIKDGICMLFVPHTTAGITINENADPSVRQDITETLAKLVPYGKGYKHLEGNADAHIKSVITGVSETIFVENGRLVLGTWQGIFFCEYDGPRRRKVLVKVVKSE